MIKFSILIPAYKALFLKEAINSIVGQTYNNWELIIVDDCSPNDLKSIVDGFDDLRIQFYRNERNYGAIDVVCNWNKCLSYATGDFVICMGDDDKLEPYCLEEYVRLIEKYPDLGVYHGQTDIIDENSNFKRVTASRIEYESVYSLIWHRWNGRSAQFIGDFLFDRNKLLECGGFYYLPYAWGSDDITAVMMAANSGIANTSKVVFNYRENDRTISSTGNIKIKMKSVEYERMWFENFLKERTDITDADTKFRSSICSSMPNYFLKKKFFQLAIDMKYHRLRGLMYWLTHLKQYRLSYLLVLSSFVFSFKKCDITR